MALVYNLQQSFIFKQYDNYDIKIYFLTSCEGNKV